MVGLNCSSHAENLDDKMSWDGGFQRPLRSGSGASVETRDGEVDTATEVRAPLFLQGLYVVIERPTGGPHAQNLAARGSTGQPGKRRELGLGTADRRVAHRRPSPGLRS